MDGLGRSPQRRAVAVAVFFLQCLFLPIYSLRFVFIVAVNVVVVSVFVIIVVNVAFVVNVVVVITAVVFVVVVVDSRWVVTLARAEADASSTGPRTGAKFGPGTPTPIMP